MPTKFKTYHCVLDWFKAFFRVAFAIRFSLALSLLAGVAVNVPDQAIEALRVLASKGDEDWPQTWPRIMFAVSALLLSLLSWYCGRVLLYLIDPLPGAKGCAERAKKFWVCHLPRIVGALPLLFIAVALFRAADSKTPEGMKRAPHLIGAAFVSLLLAFLLYCFFHFRRWLEGRMKGQKVKVGCDERVAQGGFLPGVSKLARSGRIVLVVAFLVWASLLIIFTFDWGRHGVVGAAVTFGPLALVLLFAALWVPVGSGLVYASHLTRLPIFLILLIFAFTFSALDCNDNHAIRLVKTDKQVKPPMDINTGFAEWLKNRCDKDNYGPNNAYPVFIVSAEGGGLRAGYFASLVLSKLQDANPAFAHHVFAISGVSGGSLGGAVFAAMAHKYVKPKGATPCQFKTEDDKENPINMKALNDKVLGHDVLSPILASLLYPDLLQRFLPFSVERFDRGRAAEDALRYYWREATGDWEFDNNYQLSNLYEPNFETGSTPALFFNTTRVETGEQLVVSNLNPAGSDEKGNIPLNGLKSLTDLDPTLPPLPLVSAAYMSARFPVVAPAGYLKLNPNCTKVRFVDGGYFENSGTATLLDLLSALKLEEVKTNIKIIVIRIGSSPPELDAEPCPNESAETGQDERCGQAEQQYRAHGLGEITSPIFALLNTRTARGNLSVMQLRAVEAQLGKHPCAESKSCSVEEAHFDLARTKEIKLPTGYLLSKEARDEMCKQVRVEKNGGACDDTSTAETSPPARTMRIQKNNEAFDKVLNALGPKP